MKQMIVKASDLDKNCWLPMRFAKKCWDCGRYNYCSYPERVANKEYDALLAAVRESRRLLAKWREDHR